MYKKSVLSCFLLSACFGLLEVLPAKAASLELVPEWGASGVPTNVSMYVYVPDSVVENPPILVLLHYWGGTASSVFAQAEWGGIVAAADQYGFIMVVPERSSDCWDYGSTQSLTHDGGGETHAIAQMVQYAISTYQANADRVYVTGDSCGGMMTQAMLGVYPDIFKAGVALAGVPIGGAWAPIEHTVQEWGDLARACYPEYSGPRPRVQLWHGTADDLVNYTNHLESIMQWSNVLGLDPDPTYTTTESIAGITNQWTHRVWKDENGASLLDAWADIGGDHGPSDALFLAEYVIPFLGLDKVGPVDPGPASQPDPWQSVDIGSVGLLGSASITGGTFTVTGSGADIWGNSDAFRYVYTAVTGDCSLVAHIVSQDNTDPWAKGGIMIRSSLADGAPNALVGVTPGNGLSFQWRSVSDGDTGFDNSGTTGLGAPYWIKLVRSGDSFTAYRSVDGTNWLTQGSPQTISMGSTVYVGLAVTAHNSSQLCTAVFDQVSISGDVPSVAGKNPIFRDAFTADPAPLVVGDTVYVYTGHDEGTNFYEMTEWLCYSSTNLLDWTAHGPIMNPGDFSWSDGSATAWASQVIERNGQYFLYATVQHDATQGGKAVGVAVSSSPTGPFVDARGSALVTDGMTTGGDAWDDIDPTIFKDDDGSYWLGWGHGTFYLAKLKDNLTELDGAIQSFSLPDYTEGPWLFKRNDLYYMAYPSIDSVNGGSERTAYATAPAVTGPWTYQGLITGTAQNSYTIHPGIIEVRNQWYFFYHNATLSLDGVGGSSFRRSVCVEYMDFNPDGTIRPVVQTVAGVSMLRTRPTDLVAEDAAGDVQLGWNTVPGATNYVVRRSSVSGGPYSVIGSTTSPDYLDAGASETRYYYVVSAVVDGSETLNSAETTLDFPMLAGSVIGTSGSWGDSGDTIDKVFDGNLGTFFDAPVGNGAWVGLDFGAGTSNVIAQVKYCPRSGFESRMVGGVFQGANQSDFSDAVTLYTVSALPVSGVFTAVDISNTSAFRYVRFLSPDNGFSNVAELEFHGYPYAEPAPSVPTGLGATAVSDSQIDLSWTASANAASYNVKRSIISGGPYATVASNVVAVTYIDTSGLSAGTCFYYVVSAVNAGEESGNSNETNAVPSAVISSDEYFIADHALVSGSNLTLTVSNSVPGHDYQLWASDDLTTPDWQPVGVGQAGSGSALEFNIPVEGSSTNRYFKLDVQRQ